MGNIRWVPLADGKYVHDSIIDGRIVLEIGDSGEELQIFGPDDMYEAMSLSPFQCRLCQATPDEGIPDEGIPDEVAQTIRKVLEYHHYIASCVDDTISPDMRRLARAITWLDQQQKGLEAQDEIRD